LMYGREQSVHFDYAFSRGNEYGASRERIVRNEMVSGHIPIRWRP
jgi:hypothetical protein